jgi:UDP-N-acetylglucosamine 4-epimerase
MAAKNYDQLKKKLTAKPRRWLVTGAAGFIGSNLVETLLRLGQEVTGLDNFSTGKRENLKDLQACAGAKAWKRFRFIEGDITNLATCRKACNKAEFILHQAALASVPRSLAQPLASHGANVDGFVNLLLAARDANVKRIVYASSSAVYGDNPKLPKVEDQLGAPLSPYALTKLVNELYALNFARCYGLESIGLRYFNVFGRRQDPNGAYAAVIPKWIGLLLAGEQCVINGDGSVSRDFCYIENVVQANLLAATTQNKGAENQVYNIACGWRTTLNELYELLRTGLIETRPELKKARPKYAPFRKGDIPHSLANIGKARRLLGYQPAYTIKNGLAETLAWYASQAGN